MAPPAWAPPERMFVIGSGNDGVRLAVERGEVFVQRFSPMRRRGAGDRKRCREDCVRAKPAQIGGAVERCEAHRRCRADPRRRGPQRGGDLARDAGHGAAHARPLEIRLVAVAQLVRLVAAGRSAGRRAGAAERAIFEMDVGLDGRAAAGIEYLARRQPRYPGSRHECDSRMLAQESPDRRRDSRSSPKRPRLAAAVSRSLR